LAKPSSGPIGEGLSAAGRRVSSKPVLDDETSEVVVKTLPSESGQIPTRFIELLNRPVTNYWAGRDGEKDWQWPPDSHQGPKCMLINGLAGSGGDAFPNYFRWNHLGKLIGMRTWGGLVGISGNPALIDGGYSQLDAAIGEVLTECDQHPFKRPKRPKRPAYPDKSGMGIVETDK